MKFLVLAVVCSVFVVAYGRHSHVTVTTGPECVPRRKRSTCGERVLHDEISTPAEGYGINVCNVTKYLEVQTLKYVDTTYCYRSGHCYTYCHRTSNCTGPMINITKNKVKCCEGFAIDPEDKEDAGDYSYYFKKHFKRTVLKKQGCSLVLEKSVTDCLLSLNLTMFTAELLKVPDLLSRLENENEEYEKFTVFALPDAELDGVSFSVEGHVVNSQVIGKKLRGGKVLGSLIPNATLHVGKVVTSDEKTYYVNGVEITEVDACRASNGVVHLISRPIPQSSKTIAEILTPDSEYSTFRSLLDAAGITKYLKYVDKSLTVLAPTNDAFNDLPDEKIVECLVEPANKGFLMILLHVHIGYTAEYSSTLSQRKSCSTLAFNSISVEEEDGTIFVTEDRIPLEKLDMPASNGVIHTLPEVIIPPGNPCTDPGAA